MRGHLVGVGAAAAAGPAGAITITTTIAILASPTTGNDMGAGRLSRRRLAGLDEHAFELVRRSQKQLWMI